MKSLKNVLFYSLITLAILFSLEGGLRMWEWTIPQSNQNKDGLGDKRYLYKDVGQLGNLMPNQDGHWLADHMRPYHVQTNSQGFRNTEDAREGALRIMVTGGSMTFGPFVKNSDTWPAWAENQIRTQYPKQDIQLFNAAYKGSSVEDRLFHFKEKALQYKPDIFIFPIASNFAGLVRDGKIFHYGEEAIRQQTKFYTIRHFLGENSAVYNFLKRLKNKGKAPHKETAPGDGEMTGDDPAFLKKQNFPRIERTLKTFIGLAHKNNIKPILLWLPLEADYHTPSWARQLVHKIGDETSTPVIDAGDTVFQHDPEAIFLMAKDPTTGELKGNGHYSRFGNFIIGREVGKQLAGLLAQRFSK